MKNTLQYYRLKGAEARSHFRDMANLRISVFREFPYLYEGSIEYEKDYLETYYQSSKSFIFLVKDNDALVGMTTCIQASDEKEDFKQVFEKFNLHPKNILYLGESILLPAYRGQGLGKVFFHEREKFGQSLSLSLFSFCSVIRPDNHPLKPQSYQNLSIFWKQMGYQPVPNMTTDISWKDINEMKENKKTMQYWIKDLKK